MTAIRMMVVFVSDLQVVKTNIFSVWLFQCVRLRLALEGEGNGVPSFVILIL